MTSTIESLCIENGEKGTSDIKQANSSIIVNIVIEKELKYHLVENRSWFWSKVLSLQLICSPTLTAANFQIKPCHHGQSISTEIFSRYLILRDSDSKSQEGEDKNSFPLYDFVPGL